MTAPAIVTQISIEGETENMDQNAPNWITGVYAYLDAPTHMTFDAIISFASARADMETVAETST